MAIQTLIGSRLRERRQALGLRQADLAARAGISASYLNLIEHNRRRLAPDLLQSLARELGLDPQALEAGAGGHLADELRAAAAAVPGAGAELDRVEDLAGRYPGWAATLAQMGARLASLTRAVEVLNDRMSHDPYLSASLHELLSSVASVRSTSAILADTDDLEPEWRERFLKNLHQDSERLAAGAEALVGYLDTGSANAEAAVSASPQEEVEAWAEARDWDLAGPETALAAIATDEGRLLGLGLMQQAASDRAALPETRLAAAIAQHGLDPLAIAAATGAPPLATFRRLALRPGAAAGFVSCDASGTLLWRKALPGFPVPRFGAACALWPIFRALGHPMTPVEALVETQGPQPRRFRIRAFAETRYPEGFRGPELREAAMLILPAETAAGPGQAALPVGTSCRICPRRICPARREPTILRD